MHASTAVSMRTSASVPAQDEAGDVHWTLALAGGEGVRLQDYVRHRFGEVIPKQYCRLIGRRSLLEHTLDRLNRLTPPTRTMTVIGTEHRAWARPQLRGRSDHVFCQPFSRDTAVALYVALAMIVRWNPNAVVTIVPTDQYVAPADHFLAAVHAARRLAARFRELVVLLGVPPTEPDPELGYIVLGPQITGTPELRQVEAFIEKPEPARAREISRAGALWSTMVTCGTATALWELGRSTSPYLLGVLDALVPLIGTEEEDEAIDYIYRATRPVSFARDVCERGGARVAAMAIPDIDWSDLGRADRVERVRARHGHAPA